MLRPNSLMFLFALLSYMLEYQRSNSVTLEVLLGHRIQNLPYPSLYFTLPRVRIQFFKTVEFSKNHMGEVMTTCSTPTSMALGSRYIIHLYSLFLDFDIMKPQSVLISLGQRSCNLLQNQKDSRKIISSFLRYTKTQNREEGNK